jgi:hypothetical protein
MDDFLKSLAALKSLNEAEPATTDTPTESQAVDGLETKSWEEQWLVEPEAYSDIMAAYHTFEATLKGLKPAVSNDVSAFQTFSKLKGQLSVAVRSLHDVLASLGNSASMVTEGAPRPMAPAQLESLQVRVATRRRKRSMSVGPEACGSMALRTENGCKNPGQSVGDMSNVVDGKIQDC